MQVAFHVQVRDPRVEELLAMRTVAETLVETEGMCLGVQLHRPQTALTGVLLRGPHQSPAGPGTACLRQDGQAPQQAHPLLFDDHAHRADGHTAAQGEEVVGVGVAAVPLLLDGDVLFGDEHRAADDEHGGAITLALGRADLVGRDRPGFGKAHARTLEGVRGSSDPTRAASYHVGMEQPRDVHPEPADPGRERARYWHFRGLPGTELLTARFVTTAFTRHSHETYTIGVITEGVEEWTHARGRSRVGPGGLAVVEPGEVHTGHAGVPQGWAYRVFYPSVEVVSGIARELGIRGTPSFTGSGIHAPEVAGVLARAHLEAETGDPLGASSMARQGIALLLREHGRERAVRVPAYRARPEAERARQELVARLVDPPSLEELSAGTGLSPFALTRAFRSAFGLPPHAYLNQTRVARAREMLRAGRRPSEVAAEVGFADQAHLTRHFRRHLGVPPAAYRRDVAVH